MQQLLDDHENLAFETTLASNHVTLFAIIRHPANGDATKFKTGLANLLR
ncbi:MAG: hypothetical protein JZU65_20430 [Chlorobium sp.]|jgi:hypothetical protein|nr:hypothetical protein [Chlorobium sp.]